MSIGYVSRNILLEERKHLILKFLTEQYVGVIRFVSYRLCVLSSLCRLGKLCCIRNPTMKQKLGSKIGHLLL